MYLSVRRADIADFSKLCDFGFDFIGKGDRRKDGKGARLEAH